ncbi:MBL fold metallo-hydrolase [Pseudovibrio sp. SPO723]|uniref:MBL fold metallo-hydrolase n=1 Tax=Nesiotobacter zosterae TaxID=392721 RepID=UPI0029C55E56|nr:MBL fold metallo-hydrolase [Pseudovibrio sp. SPO723]MDX5593574.1 MBL fold metallo-hydrolase [Pseudovibrio sp. SPO723]
MHEFSLKIWGVRGSTPTPGTGTLRYGGETTCFEIRAGDDLIVVDCGSGARNLGYELVKGPGRPVDLFFSHTHLDHICGLPFFKPAYDPRFHIKVWAGCFNPHRELKDVICRVMSPPVFPITASNLKGIEFGEFIAGSCMDRDSGLRICTMPLNHPGGACGYKFIYDGKSMCIITDHEMGDAEIDDAVVEFIRDAEVVIYDGMYTSVDYEKYKGYGHSTWEHVVEQCVKANVKTPVIFHHDPTRTDDELDEIGIAAKERHPGALIASEGMVFRP